MVEMAHIRERVTAFCDSTTVPGYLVGVYQAGEQTILSHGVANVVTSAPMREDTGSLFGSITKVMTTTDDVQEAIFTRFAGGAFSAPPQRYVPVGKGLFARPESRSRDSTGIRDSFSSPTTARAMTVRLTGVPVAA
jgi:hypothetical protein